MLLLLARDEDLEDVDELELALRKLREHVAADLAREYVSLMEAAAEREANDE